jgi:hypothetical protein
MPNYKNKETGDIVRFPSVRITWDDEMANQKELTMTAMHGLDQWENILDTYDFVQDDGGVYNVKMKKARLDGHGMR